MTALKVREFMSREVETLAPDATMEQAVVLEMRRRIRHIPIVEDGRLVGILTDRDLKRAMPSLLTGTDQATHERVMKTTNVQQLMTRSPVTITPDTSLRDAAAMMVEKRFGALPVVEKDHLVGILTKSDVLRALVRILDRGV